jgi:hypothetical protein
MIQVKTLNQTGTELILSEVRKQDVYCVMSKESSATIPKLGNMAPMKRLMFEMV